MACCPSRRSSVHPKAPSQNIGEPPLFWQIFQRFSNYDFRFLKWCDPKSVTIFQVKICEVGGEGLFLPLFGDAEQAGGCIADRFQSDWYDFLLTPRLLFF